MCKRKPSWVLGSWQRLERGASLLSLNSAYCNGVNWEREGDGQFKQRTFAFGTQEFLHYLIQCCSLSQISCFSPHVYSFSIFLAEIHFFIVCRRESQESHHQTEKPPTDGNYGILYFCSQFNFFWTLFL